MTKEYTCKKCNNNFTTEQKRGYSKYCKDCKIIIQRERSKLQWQKKHGTVVA